jgi:hypothetical protein
LYAKKNAESIATMRTESVSRRNWDRPNFLSKKTGIVVGKKEHRISCKNGNSAGFHGEIGVDPVSAQKTGLVASRKQDRANCMQ